MSIKIFIDQDYNRNEINNSQNDESTEKYITYKIGIILAKIFDKDLRFETFVSRKKVEDGENLTNDQEDRVVTDLANEWQAQFFLRLNTNISNNKLINGSEIYVYSRYTSAYIFAQFVISTLTNQVGTKNNGVQIDSSIYILQKTLMPALVIDLAYLTNEQDKLKLENNKEEFANAIYTGTLNFLGI